MTIGWMRPTTSAIPHPPRQETIGLQDLNLLFRSAKVTGISTPENEEFAPETNTAETQKGKETSSIPKNYNFQGQC